MSETQNKNKKRRRGLWIALGVIAVAIIIAGFIIWQNRQAATELLAGLETEPYQRQIWMPIFTEREPLNPPNQPY